MIAPELIGAGRRADRHRVISSRGPLIRLAAPLAAVGAIAVIALATSLIATTSEVGRKPNHADGVPGRAHWGIAAATSVAQGYPGSKLPAAAQPRYYLGVQPTVHGPTEYATTLDVYSTASGKQTSQLKLPRSGLFVQAVASLGEDTYLVAATQDWPQLGCHSWLYEFRLTAAGQPTGLKPFTVPQAPGWAMELGDSSDGSMTVLTTSICGTGKAGSFSFSAHDALTTAIQLPSGIPTRWSPGNTLFNVNGPSTTLSADGRLLALVAIPGHPRGIALSEQAAYVMLTGPVSGPVSSRYRMVLKPPGGAIAAALSPNGRVMFLMTAQRAGRRWHETIGAYATATGKLITVLASGSWRSLNAQGSLIPDPSGRHLLVFGFGNGVGTTAVLDVATRHLRVLHVGYATYPLGAAW
jgi:hypothetical protein